MVLQSHHSEREHDVHPGGDHHPPHTVSVMGVVPRIAGAGEGAMVALVQQTATNWVSRNPVERESIRRYGLVAVEPQVHLVLSGVDRWRG